MFFEGVHKLRLANQIQQLNRNTLSIIISCMLVCAFCLPACSSSDNRVAASLLGEDITEQEVTDYIQTFRETSEYTEESDWESYLEEKGLTAEQFRTNTIYELAAKVVIKHVAKENDIEIDDDAVQERINNMRTSFLAEDDETWKETLEKYNTDEKSLRERFEVQNLQQQVYNKLIDRVTPTDKDIKNYIKSNLLGSTTKKVFHIYASDYTTMQKMLREIQKSSTVAEGIKSAKKQADGKKIIAEDLSWDFVGNLTQDMSEKIEDLGKGEIADSLLSDSSAYHILYVEDVYTFPKKKVNVNQLPKSIKKAASEAAEPDLWDTKCANWLRAQIESSIEINYMPDGLPYATDTSSSSEESSTDADSDK